MHNTAKVSATGESKCDAIISSPMLGSPVPTKPTIGAGNRSSASPAMKRPISTPNGKAASITEVFLASMPLSISTIFN